MSGDPNRGPAPGCLSVFLPSGFGFPIAIRSVPSQRQTSPGRSYERRVRLALIAGGLPAGLVYDFEQKSVRQIEQLRDGFLVGGREFVLVHLVGRNPAVVVDASVGDFAAGQLAAIDAEVDVVVRVAVVDMDDPISDVHL